MKKTITEQTCTRAIALLLATLICVSAMVGCTGKKKAEEKAPTQQAQQATVTNEGAGGSTPEQKPAEKAGASSVKTQQKKNAGNSAGARNSKDKTAAASIKPQITLPAGTGKNS